jgi:ribosomal protein L39E
LTGTIETHPEENSNWRRHKNACPNYRERWFPCNDVSGEPMYQVFCLNGTPPETLEEQEKCFRSKVGCWRLAKRNKQNQQTPEEEPMTTAQTASR